MNEIAVYCFFISLNVIASLTYNFAAAYVIYKLKFQMDPSAKVTIILFAISFFVRPINLIASTVP